MCVHTCLSAHARVLCAHTRTLDGKGIETVCLPATVPRPWLAGGPGPMSHVHPSRPLLNIQLPLASAEASVPWDCLIPDEMPQTFTPEGSESFQGLSVAPVVDHYFGT